MLYANTGAAPRQAVMTAGPAVWLDLLDPTDPERAEAERATGLRVPTREQVAEIESSSRIYAEAGVAYLSMPYSFLDEDGQSHVTAAGFVLSDQHLLTVRYAVLPAFETYAATYAAAGPRGSAETFIGLAEVIVDRMADVLERVAAELDRLSKTTFHNPAAGAGARRADSALRALLSDVGRSGDALGNLRDSVLGLGRIITFTQQFGEAWPAALKAQLATLRADLASLNDYDQQLSNKTGFLLDAVLGFINIEQNNGVRVLTVASVVGIPPTFVVGLYGMNFKNMPEYEWTYGYQFGLAMVVLSIIVPLVWCRAKGLL